MRFVLAAALLAGCYKPTVASCQLTCAADRSCPDGFSCSTANHCIANGESDQCSEIVVDGALPGDVAVDIGIVGDPCDFTVSNVSDVSSLCSLLQGHSTGDLQASSGTPIITGRAGEAVAPPTGVYATLITEMGVELVVVVVTKLVVDPGVTLVVQGDRPLVLVSLSDMIIQGEITMVPTMSQSTECGGGVDGALASGGGGGGYGGAGAAGGGETTGLGGAGGAANGSPMLVPLRTGCQGGKGYANSGTGGSGGGGIELAAHGELRIESTGIVKATGVGGDGNGGMLTGGGGGGTGGSIFLEASPVVLDSGATLCANGGTGGSTNAGGPPFTPSTGCTTTPTPGAMIGEVGGDGGAADGPATKGQAGSSAAGTGGAGGGGSAGRIRIHGQLMDGGAVLTPKPFED